MDKSKKKINGLHNGSKNGRAQDVSVQDARGEWDLLNILLKPSVQIAFLALWGFVILSPVVELSQRDMLFG